ncbi:MAG: heme lyase CcmF/NrfE family subunit [Candidatus Marinimicrobia bacterium]|nr:heme lyase CcmF/NrfE family subunit [Candidatus Neomarinimicrobiota bacterium]MDP6835616.1 heme lyase CcmF/NrfE family subunit [Candidatus Neomarinimicrobiota bacterium]
MPVYGATLLNLSLGLAVLTLVALFFYVRGGDYRLFQVGQRASLGVSFLVLLATVTLITNLLQGNFDVDYVAKYTSQATPVLYKLSALWAGQSGSLLFWLFILSIYSVIVVIQNRSSYHDLMPYVIITLTVIQLFFLFLVNFVENPFRPVQADFVVQDGLGLNPLLQNPTMVIHPPMLYLGYVGFSVPFAFAIAALISRRLDVMWVRSIRRWTLFTWLALGCGIILGGWWAYIELGWGGYWAWDPVENASFMPWLTGTAFVHSIIIQEKKKMLRVWNMVLIIGTFVLCIFGTFLTRSGIVSSVHSFTQSSLGPMFLGFVLFIIVVTVSLLITRMKDLRSETHLDSFLSRESGFLFNNVVFVSICFAVLWGTLFPIISEAVTGSQITVGAPFFNQVAVPIGLFLLLLMGVGPLLAWKRTSKESLIRNFSIPVLAGLVALFSVFLLGVRSPYPLVAIFLSFFVLGTIVLEFTRAVRVRRGKRDESIPVALIRIISKNRTRYGGYIVHIGIVFMFIGFVGKAFDVDQEWTMQKGDEVNIAGYAVTLTDVNQEERPNHFAWIASLNVSKDGQHVTDLHPEKRIYFHTNPDPNRRQPHSELDLYSTFREDVYAVLGSIDTNNDILSIKIMVNRLVRWVWIGGYLLVLGSIIAFWPARSGRK